jgi:hypothetical protein
MEPLRPEFRLALKEAHPGLTDADIDRYEELVAARFQIDPDREPQRLSEIDRQREELLQTRMPRYREVRQRMSQTGGSSA